MSPTDPTPELIIRLATTEDLAQIDYLDSLSSSPTRDIHRDVEKYFGSIDPSTHEHTFIFLAELSLKAVAKAELMVPPANTPSSIGYIKRVIVHPDMRGRGLSRKLLEYALSFARHDLHLSALDLHVWDQNLPAIHLYESLGFNLQHKELYYRLSLS